MSEKSLKIEFRRNLCVVLEGRKRGPLRFLKVGRGSRYRVRLVPYHKGQQEVADLYFRNGSVAREIAFNYFRFVDDHRKTVA
ncbi:MAG: hypothetical protein HY040_27760 [Planctomycetes bacterium]|nr:hypothetical protein [Planctomycetota bacterium]